MILKSGGPVLRRLSVLVAAFALTLTGLAAPAYAADGLTAFITPSSDQIPSGQSLSASILIGADPTIVPQSIKVVTTLPTGVTFERAACGPDGNAACPDGPCEASASTVTCTVTGTKPSSEPSYVFNFSVRVEGAVGSRATISTEATAEKQDGTQVSATSETTVRIVQSSDVGIKVEKISGPSGPDNVVRYTYVLHNYGPLPVAAGNAVFLESGEPQGLGLYGFKPAKVSCFQETTGPMSCGTGTALAPGQETRATRELAIPAGSKLWGTKVTMTASVFDNPPGTGGDPANNVVRFELDFTGKPATGGGTAAPAPGDGSGGEGGGLPITGTPTLAIAGGGVALLVIGVVALLLTRRSRVK
ncbi:hypothetical protein [Paractinoplanes lichenicola]|uniref:Gram-positive cocci surface proteins LPxTG domain-containing protein n=1 Tax=Paractinoplanes lichenicola TaxID=2802976 RepID=A0ABS1VTI8_9ACTN|nr:hypothetical protein [Actinoplanes lichenicola]MBL7257786.1 hypothetical protein [Actinoplanes lichenicola]